MPAIRTCRVLRPDPRSLDRREEHHRAIFSACHLSDTTVLVTVRGEVDATNSRALAGYVERQTYSRTEIVAIRPYVLITIIFGCVSGA